MSDYNLILKIRGLCPIIFEGDGQRAVIGVLRESCHVPKFTLVSTDENLKTIDNSSQMEGIASLLVLRDKNSGTKNEINRLCKTMPDNIIPEKTGEFGFIQCAVNIQKQLYLPLKPEDSPLPMWENLNIRTWMMRFRLFLNDGEFYVSQLFVEPSADHPKKIPFYVEPDRTRIVHETYLPEEITVRTQLGINDVAILTFDSGQEFILKGTESHELSLSNLCYNQEGELTYNRGGEDDFSYHYVMYDLAGKPRVRPLLKPHPGDGSTLCNPGYNCKPPSLCS